MSLKQKIKYSIGVIVILASGFLPAFITAATLSARPLVTKVNTGGSFTLSVDVNTQGKTINNSEAVISFPNELVEVTSINAGGSIFSIWVEPATFSNSSGTISFNGGVPNPGYTGGSGHLLSVNFKAKATGTATFSFASAAVRENDGLGTNILSGRNGGSITISGPSTEPTPPASTTPGSDITVTSSTHPDNTKWYNKSRAVFSWKLPGGTISSQTSLDKTSGITPRVLRRPAVSTIAIDDIADGTWYFNARVSTASGWSKVYSYKINVDTTAPDTLVINPVSSDGKYQNPSLSAHDGESGIDYFLVEIDGATGVKIKPTGEETEIIIPGITKGSHDVIAYAYDFAGNKTVTEANVEFNEQSLLKITDYTKIIKEDQRIEASGIGPANASINIHLITEDGLSRTYTIIASDTGLFNFKSEPIAATGAYTMWAEILSPDGSIKASSEHLQIIVKAPILARFSHAILSLRYLVTPSNLLILVLFILAVAGWFNYFALKRSIRVNEARKPIQKLQKPLNKK